MPTQKKLLHDLGAVVGLFQNKILLWTREIAAQGQRIVVAVADLGAHDRMFRKESNHSRATGLQHPPTVIIEAIPRDSKLRTPRMLQRSSLVFLYKYSVPSESIITHQK